MVACCLITKKVTTNTCSNKRAVRKEHCKLQRLMTAFEEPDIQFFCFRPKATSVRAWIQLEFFQNDFGSLGIYLRRAGLHQSLQLIPLNLPATH